MKIKTNLAAILNNKQVVFTIACLKAIGNVLVFIGNKFKQDRLIILSQSLAYTTVLSIVPIFIIFFSILGRLSTSAEMQGRIFQIISGFILPDFIGNVFSKLEQLSQDALKLGAVGLPLLMLVGVSMYMKVDRSINIIWSSRTSRKISKNVVAFLMSIFIGPFLLIIVFSLPTYLQTLPYLGGLASNQSISFMLNKLAPLMLTVGIFTLLYRYVPMKVVKWRSAAAGGLVCAILLGLDNMLLGLYLKNFSSYGLIYGSLSALPIFFLWIYSIWVVVLTGALVSYTAQNYSHTIADVTRRHPPAHSDLNSSLGILLKLTEAFQQGRPAPALNDIEKRLGIPTVALESIIDTLIDAGMVSKVSPPGKASSNLRYLYQLSISPSLITLNMLRAKMHEHLPLGSDNYSLGEFFKSVQTHPLFLTDANILEIYENPTKFIGLNTQQSSDVNV